MPDFSLRTVRISLALMTLAGYLALVTTDSFGPEITIVPLIMIASMRYFERLDARSKLYQRISQIVTLAFTLIVVPYLFTDLIPALTAIILFVQIYLFLHKKGVKEYRYLFLMAFFLLVDAVAQSPDPGFALVMPVFVLSAVWAFASVQIHAEFLANQKGNIADLLPEEERRGFLPPEVAQWVSGGQRDKMTVAPVLTGISVGCVIATLLFFLLTPRMEAGVFGRSNLLAQTQRSGLSDGINLSEGGNISADEAPVFLVRFPKELPGKPPRLGDTDELYWRVTSYNRLIGAEWDRRDGDFDMIEWRNRGGGTIERTNPPVSGRLVEQEIFLENTRGLTGVPTLPWAFRLTPNSTARFLPDEIENMTIRVVGSVSQGLSYRVESRILRFTREQLLAASPDYGSSMGQRALLSLYTENRLSERARTLARSITEGTDSPYLRAIQIENYLKSSQNFIYTTSLESLSATDPIDDFLFVRRMGHCELYASSMCMMLRSLGIPARVVSGFRTQAEDWSEADNAYIVRQRHAHLWVEVYLNGIGWYMFDPSGEEELDRSTWAVLQRTIGRYTLNAKYLYYQDIIGFRSGIQLGNLINFSIGLFRFDVELMRSSIPSLGFFTRGLPRILILICIAIAVLWGFYLMYRSATLRRRAGPVLTYSQDQARATRLYRQLRQRLSVLGKKTQGASALELLRAIESDPAFDPVAVERIVRAYHDARFGGRPLGRERYAELMRAVRSVRRAPSKANPSLAEQK